MNEEIKSLFNALKMSNSLSVQALCALEREFQIIRDILELHRELFNYQTIFELWNTGTS